MPYVVLIAFVPLTAAAVIDIATRRLPNRLVGSGAVIAAFIAVATHSTVDAAIGAAVFCTPLLIAHLIDPGGLGFGDVKLGAALGIAVGSVDWRFVLPALGTACVAALVWAVVRRVRSVAFGPALVGGAATMLVIGGVV